MQKVTRWRRVGDRMIRDGHDTFPQPPIYRYFAVAFEPHREHVGAPLTWIRRGYGPFNAGRNRDKRRRRALVKAVRAYRAQNYSDLFAV
jgi:hypothetical protein